MKETATGPKTRDHLLAILLLPFIAIVVIPLIIYFFLNNYTPVSIENIPLAINLTTGCICLLAGLFFFSQAINLFVKIGKGTLAPWNPTKNIVIKGLYRYVRNPMLIGVHLILTAEAFLLESGNILIWTILFFVMNHLFFIIKEEPDLRKRFGEEYREYCANVPRWLPRTKAWRPEEQETQNDIEG